MNRLLSSATGQHHKIFISYRRKDATFTGRLYDSLNHFFSNAIFRDTEKIKAGSAFASDIDNALNSCSVLIVVISRNWANIKKAGARKLDDSNDFVRHEITVAINRGILVVPVLIENASMPRANLLPGPIKKLADYNARNLADKHWADDIKKLVKVIKEELEKPQKFHPLITFKERMIVLALGAHADDIELGCGATLLHLKKDYNAKIHYRVFSSKVIIRGKVVNRRSEMDKSSIMLGVADKAFYDYKDRAFPHVWELIQERIALLREQLKPDLVLVPSLQDSHQDHVVVAQGAVREFRDGQALWHYEIKQYGQDRFDPNIFINVSMRAYCADKDYIELYKKYGNKSTLAHLKVHILRKCMTSMAGRRFLDPELLLGIMSYRGIQCSRHIAYAEAFEGRMLVNGGQ